MKFSIGIPAYKSKFLKENITSILNQTYNNFELIIVNDASPEDIDSIVASFNDPRIRYYKNKINVGAEHVVDNWNICLSFAVGEYFILMGDDDMFAPNYLEEFVSLIDKYPLLDVYHCRTIIIDEKSNPLRLTEPRPEFESTYDSIVERMNSHRTFFISDYVYKTKTLNENGGFFKLPLAWASDDISSYIASGEKGIAHTNNAVFMYRENSLNITSTGNCFLKMEAVKLEENWFKNFLSKTPQNEMDLITRNYIQKRLVWHIQKKKIAIISKDICNTGYMSVGKWFIRRKDFKISTNEIIYAFIESIKKRKAFNQYAK